MWAVLHLFSEILPLYVGLLCALEIMCEVLILALLVSSIVEPIQIQLVCRLGGLVHC